MIRRTTFRLYVSIVGCTFFILTGCTHTLVVQDSHGIPIGGAIVTVQSYSIEYAQGTTDSEGRIKIKRRYAQSPKWLSITKAGYERYYGDFPSTWPCTISLQNVTD